MRVGQLDCRIRLQRRVKNEDKLGTNDYTFADVDVRPIVWAAVQPLRGREFFAASEMQSEITTRFTILYRKDIDSTMRVIWGGVPYDIAAPPIDVGGKRVWLELMCKSGVGDGR
jgi:SPP1 family predicted phage head-tail adaptor